jgi:hypothetical protein
MADMGISRAVAREIFGLAARLLGLGLTVYAGYLAITMMVENEGRHVLVGLIGVAAGVWLLLKADLVCRFTYGPPASDAPPS